MVPFLTRVFDCRIPGTELTALRKARGSLTQQALADQSQISLYRGIRRYYEGDVATTLDVIRSLRQLRSV